MTAENCIELVSNQVLLSELYQKDAPEAALLAEYPSSNSNQTRFQNTDRYIIHDPFPPPRPELLKCLGPHHLMFGWGKQLAVTSQECPPQCLVEHWSRQLGNAARPIWREFEDLGPAQQYIVLFPHQSLDASQQVVDPDVNYFLHSKHVITQINCAQAQSLDSVQYPCIAKLSHGYAGLGNYVLSNEDDYKRMSQLLSKRWPNCELVFNSLIGNIVGDFGVQFYVHKDGTTIWLGFTEQAFDENGKWCGGQYSQNQQVELLDDVHSIVNAASQYLCGRGYFGVVGIDILKNNKGEYFLVDVNPRLTGITPFLIASRIFGSDPQFREGVYRASCRFKGNLNELIEKAESYSEAKIVVLSAYDDFLAGQTTCHLAVTSESQISCSEAFDRLLEVQPE